MHNINKFFDSHTHLNSEELFVQREQHRQNFKDMGGCGLVNIGANQIYNTRAIEICKAVCIDDNTPAIQNMTKSGKYPKKYYGPNQAPYIPEKKIPEHTIACTIGLHPQEIISNNISQSFIAQEIKQMCNLYTPYKEFIVGIGECGIDTHLPGSEETIDLQKDLFGQQCDLARQWDLPIVIHSRDNWTATHDILKQFTDLTIYFHCRSYTPAEIQVIQSTYPNFYIGFCGNISYPKAVDIRMSLRQLVHNNSDYPESIISGKIDHEKTLLPCKTGGQEISNILIETDAPYLAPQSHRGETNSPALISETYNYINQLLGQNITAQVVQNAKRCYGLE